jgi:hypothetical protein
MNNESTVERWNRKGERLRDRYPDDLTEEDLIYEEGNEEELISRFQQKLGKPRSEVKQIIKSL